MSASSSDDDGAAGGAVGTAGREARPASLGDAIDLEAGQEPGPLDREQEWTINSKAHRKFTHKAFMYSVVFAAVVVLFFVGVCTLAIWYPETFNLTHVAVSTVPFVGVIFMSNADTNNIRVLENKAARARHPPLDPILLLGLGQNSRSQEAMFTRES